MYHYIKDKEFEQEMRSYCANIINQLVQRINNDDFLTVKAQLIGSGARNLITQNGTEPVDLDYNLCILGSKTWEMPSPEKIRTYIHKEFDIVLQKNGWGYCNDSKSALTTKKRPLPYSKNKTKFSIDLAIIWNDRFGRWQRLIFDKSPQRLYYPFSLPQYKWNSCPSSADMEKKIDFLKKENLWMKVRETYLAKKNMYLKRQDLDHPSFIVYIETINEIYNTYLYSKRRLIYDFRSLC